MGRKVMTQSDDEAQLRIVEDQEKELERGLEAIVNNKAARSWLYDRLDTFGHPESSSHVPGCSDSTAFNEGARSVANALLREIRERFPNQYLKMLEDNMFDQ